MVFGLGEDATGRLDLQIPLLRHRPRAGGCGRSSSPPRCQVISPFARPGPGVARISGARCRRAAIGPNSPYTVGRIAPAGHATEFRGELAKAAPKTLRYRFLHVPAVLVRGQRRRRLKIPGTWPWADEIITASAASWPCPTPPEPGAQTRRAPRGGHPQSPGPWSPAPPARQPTRAPTRHRPPEGTNATSRAQDQPTDAVQSPPTWASSAAARRSPKPRERSSKPCRRAVRRLARRHQAMDTEIAELDAELAPRPASGSRLAGAVRCRSRDRRTTARLGRGQPRAHATRQRSRTWLASPRSRPPPAEPTAISAERSDTVPVERLERRHAGCGRSAGQYPRRHGVSDRISRQESVSLASGSFSGSYVSIPICFMSDEIRCHSWCSTSAVRRHSSAR